MCAHPADTKKNLKDETSELADIRYHRLWQRSFFLVYSELGILEEYGKNPNASPALSHIIKNILKLHFSGRQGKPV